MLESDFLDQELSELKRQYNKMDSRINPDDILQHIHKNEKLMKPKKRNHFKLLYVASLVAMFMIGALLSLNFLKHNEIAPNQAFEKHSSPTNSADQLATVNDVRNIEENVKKDENRLESIQSYFKHKGVYPLYSVTLGKSLINNYKQSLDGLTGDIKGIQPLDVQGVKFQIPSQWQIRKGLSSYTFKDEKGKIVGGLDVVNINNYLPNHSTILHQEDLTGYQYKIERVELEITQPAASSSQKTVIQTHYFIMLDDKNVSLDLYLNDNIASAIDRTKLFATLKTQDKLTVGELNLGYQKLQEQLGLLYRSTTVNQINIKQNTLNVTRLDSLEAVPMSPLNKHLNIVYNNLVNTKKDSELRELDPWETVLLWYLALQHHKRDVEYLLHIKDDHYISKQQFLYQKDNGKNIATLNSVMRNMSHFEQIKNFGKITRATNDNAIYQYGEALVKVYNTKHQSIRIRLFKDNHGYWKLAWPAIDN